MTIDQQAELIHALILLIVALIGAVQAWTAWRTSQLPTKKDQLAVADALAKTVHENGTHGMSTEALQAIIDQRKAEQR